MNRFVRHTFVLAAVALTAVAVMSAQAVADPAGAEPVSAPPDTLAPDTTPSDTSGTPLPTVSPDFAAPSVELNLYEFRPEQRIQVSISGFGSAFVNTTICGNGGLRGSSDCNMAASEAVEIDPATGSASISFIANAPAMPCPCVIRVSSSGNDEVAFADVVLIGHPVADLVAPAIRAQPLTASLSVVVASTGFLDWSRSSLGGSTTYDATLTIRNQTSIPVDGVTIDGFAGRGADDVRTLFDYPQPGVIGPNETWQETVRVTLDAPVYGNTTWSVAVASANPTVSVDDSTSHLPGLLIAFVGFLLFDLVVLLARLVRRRRIRRRLASDTPSTLEDETVATAPVAYA